MKLVCLPYAGGSALMFSAWKERFPDVEVIPMELPGRGLRFKEKNAPNMKTLAQDLADRVEQKVQNDDYILLGFCYGAIVAYAVYQELQRRKDSNLPVGVIVMSSLPPGMHSTAELVFTMPNYKLVKYLLKSLNYDPSDDSKKSNENGEAILKLFSIVNPELTQELQSMKPFQLIMSFLYPSGSKGHEIQNILNVLKDDGRIMAAYDPEESDVRIDVPVAAIRGMSDEVVRQQDVDAWCEFCTGDFQRYDVTGAHMMLLDSETDALDVIEDIMKRFQWRVQDVIS